MKYLLIVLFVVSLLPAREVDNSRIDKLLTQQQQIFTEQRPNILMFGAKDSKKTYDLIAGKYLDSAKSSPKTEDTAKAVDMVSDMPSMSPHVGGSGGGISPAPPVSSTGYVSYETYHRDMMDMRDKISTMENTIDKLVSAIEGTQKIGVDNRKYTLDLLNILLTFIGTGGVAIVGLFLSYFVKKKKKD